MLLVLVMYSVVVPDNLKVQLLKLPYLVQHFIHHNHYDRHNSIDFLDFLASHYNNSTDTDKEHENLPFKNSDSNFQNTILVYITTFFAYIKLINHQCSVYKPKLNIKNFCYKFSYLTSIWRPPKCEFKTVA